MSNRISRPALAKAFFDHAEKVKNGKRLWDQEVIGGKFASTPGDDKEAKRLRNIGKDLL